MCSVNKQFKLHLAITSFCIFPSLRLVKLHVTRGLSLAYAVTVLTCVVLLTCVLLFTMVPLDSIIDSKRSLNKKVIMKQRNL
jgi:hypothetical protein